MGPTFLSSSVTVGDPSQRPESQPGKKPVVSQRYVTIAHALKTTLRYRSLKILQTDEVRAALLHNVEAYPYFFQGQIRLPHQRSWCNCVGTRTWKICNFITLGCIQRQNTAHGAIQKQHHHRLVVRTFPDRKQHPRKEHHLLWVLPVWRESPSRLERNDVSRWGGKYHLSHWEDSFSDEVVSLRRLC